VAPDPSKTCCMLTAARLGLSCLTF
jgi:hypothetical protein